MLTAAQFDELVVPITELYEKYQTSVIEDIARRLGNMSFDSAAWQVQRLTESGGIYEDILERLTVLTGQSKEILKQTFEKVGVQAMRFDDSIYKKAGLNPIPLNLSPAMLNVLKAGLEKTNGIMRNLTQTTAITGQNAFIDALDLAYMQVSTGAMSYQQALTEGVRSVARNGLTTIQYAGRQDQLDVAIRRAVLTGVGQTTGQLQITRADEMGTDLVQTSAHIGARNTGTGPANHESWQGKVFSRSGTNPNYPNFVEVTGYGTGAGLNGYNCRHSFYPFFEGISENAYSEATLDDYANETVTYDDKEISVYEATQKQRAIEREIRATKREAAGLEAAGLPSDTERLRIRNLQSQMRDFVNQTGLQRQSFREQIYVNKNTKLFKDISGVRITMERMRHWRIRHPEVTQDFENNWLEKAITKPDFVQLSKSDSNVKMNYLLDENKKWWVVVINYPENGTPFVLTIRRAHKKGK